MEREALDINIDELERRIAICYTASRGFPGINNWEIYKRHIDGDTELFELFDGIRDSARNIREALLADDWEQRCRRDEERLSESETVGADDHDAADGHAGRESAREWR
jgi:D-glycero-alpha-D-manno-heptose-7-phosphate kinase